MDKTLSCPLPSNINPLSPNGFNFTIQKIPSVNFFCQQVNLPGLTFGDPSFATPFASVPIPGDHITYDNLSVNFLVDENMENYRAIWNWIVALGFPQSYDQYITFINASQPSVLNELAKNYSDGMLEILGSSNTAVATIEFVDMFPVALDTILFQSTNQDVPYIVGQATFRYSYYKFI
jgi:hypothetical protein